MVDRGPSPGRGPQSLDYFGTGPAEPGEIDEGEGIRSARALYGALLSLAAVSIVIGTALLEPSPGLRRAALSAAALVGMVGAGAGLWALRGDLSQVDRTLIAAGGVLGAGSAAAAVVLF